MGGCQWLELSTGRHGPNFSQTTTATKLAYKLQAGRCFMHCIISRTTLPDPASTLHRLLCHLVIEDVGRSFGRGDIEFSCQKVNHDQVSSSDLW